MPIRAGRAVADAANAMAACIRAAPSSARNTAAIRKAVELVRGGAIGRLKRVYAYQFGGGVSRRPHRPADGAPSRRT